MRKHSSYSCKFEVGLPGKARTVDSAAEIDVKQPKSVANRTERGEEQYSLNKARKAMFGWSKRAVRGSNPEWPARSDVARRPSSLV